MHADSDQSWKLDQERTETEKKIISHISFSLQVTLDILQLRLQLLLGLGEGGGFALGICKLLAKLSILRLCLGLRRL